MYYEGTKENGERAKIGQKERKSRVAGPQPARKGREVTEVSSCGATKEAAGRSSSSPIIRERETS